MELSTAINLDFENLPTVNALIQVCFNCTNNVTIQVNETDLETMFLNSSFWISQQETGSVKGLTITDTPLRKIARFMDYYFVPFIIAAGLIGNTLSF